MRFVILNRMQGAESNRPGGWDPEKVEVRRAEQNKAGKFWLGGGRKSPVKKGGGRVEKLE